MTVTDGLDRSSQQQIRILLRMMKILSGKMRVGWLNLQNAFWQNDCLFWFALRYIKVYDYEYIHSTDTRIINENSVDECKSYDTSVRPAVSVSLLVFPFAARPKTMQTCSENKNMNNWHSAAVWGDVLLVTNEEQPKLSRAFIYTSVRKVECNRMILQGHFSVFFSFCFLIWVRPKISIRIRIRYRILILQGHSTTECMGTSLVPVTDSHKIAIGSQINETT